LAVEKAIAQLNPTPAAREAITDLESGRDGWGNGIAGKLDEIRVPRDGVLHGSAQLIAEVDEDNIWLDVRVPSRLSGVGPVEQRIVLRKRVDGPGGRRQNVGGRLRRRVRRWGRQRFGRRLRRWRVVCSAELRMQYRQRCHRSRDKPCSGGKEH